MTKNPKIITIAIIFLLVVFLLLPINYPIAVKSKGKLLPYKTWLLVKGTDGRLIASLTDNSTGINSEYSVTQFERGDAVQFKFNSEVINKDVVTQGDAIGFVISNEIEKDIQKLKGELATAKASLGVQTSSEKESIIEAEKSKLVFAEKELDEQIKIYERKKKLYEQDLISQQEFEADEARYELAKINISIAKERLRTVQSGSKKEEVNYTATRITALENEISVLQKRFESNSFISPISGVINRTFSSDTLLVINDTSKNVILLPIVWEDSKKLQLNQNVLVSSSGIKDELNGKIISIGNVVNTVNNIQYILVSVVSEDKSDQLKSGLYVDCKIDCGSATALNIF